VQSLDYELQRSRDVFGRAYGCAQGGLMDVTVLIGSKNKTKVFYEYMNSFSVHSFTLLFYSGDASQLTNYATMTVADGYVVDIKEKYNKDAAVIDEEQICLTLKILLTKITYKGVNSQLESIFVE